MQFDQEQLNRLLMNGQIAMSDSRKSGATTRRRNLTVLAAGAHALQHLSVLLFGRLGRHIHAHDISHTPAPPAAWSWLNPFRRQAVQNGTGFLPFPNSFSQGSNLAALFERRDATKRNVAGARSSSAPSRAAAALCPWPTGRSRPQKTARCARHLPRHGGVNNAIEALQRTVMEDPNVRRCLLVPGLRAATATATSSVRLPRPPSAARAAYRTPPPGTTSATPTAPRAPPPRRSTRSRRPCGSRFVPSHVPPTAPPSRPAQSR